MKVDIKDIETLRNNLTSYVQRVKDSNFKLEDSLQTIEEDLLFLKKIQDEYVDLIKTYRFDSSSDYFASFSGNIHPKPQKQQLARDAEVNKELRDQMAAIENSIILQLGNFKKSFKEFSTFIIDASDAYAKHKELWDKFVKQIEQAPKDI